MAYKSSPTKLSSIRAALTKIVERLKDDDRIKGSKKTKKSSVAKMKKASPTKISRVVAKAGKKVAKTVKKKKK